MRDEDVARIWSPVLGVVAVGGLNCRAEELPSRLHELPCVSIHILIPAVVSRPFRRCDIT